MGDRLGIRSAVDFLLPVFLTCLVLAKKYGIGLVRLSTHLLDNGKTVAPGEARTHGLQIMRLTRCLLRYGGTWSRLSHHFNPTHSLLHYPKEKLCQKGDSNPRPHQRTRNLHLSPIGGQSFRLESGALDHSAILTTCKWSRGKISQKVVIRARVELATFCV